MKTHTLPESPYRRTLRRARMHLQLAREWHDMGKAHDAYIHRVAARAELNHARHLRIADRLTAIHMNASRAYAARLARRQLVQS